MHFKYQIEGRVCKPLTLAFKKQTVLKSDKQQRYLSIITEYINDEQFIKSSQNILTDCSSRPINAISIDACDLPALTAEQVEDTEITLTRTI